MGKKAEGGRWNSHGLPFLVLGDPEILPEFGLKSSHVISHSFIPDLGITDASQRNQGSSGPCPLGSANSGKS